MPETNDEASRIERAQKDVLAEISLSRDEGPWPWRTPHEGFAHTAEKMDKLKVHVWLNQKKRVPADVRRAAVAVAASAIRFHSETMPGDTVASLGLAAAEVQRARDLGFGPARSAHEGFAIIAEEHDEFKEHIWTASHLRDTEEMLIESIQVAAMALRFAAEAESEEWVRR